MSDGTLIAQLLSVASWAEARVVAIDCGGPFYSKSEPYRKAMNTAQNAAAHIAYLNGKIDGFRIVGRNAKP